MLLRQLRFLVCLTWGAVLHRHNVAAMRLIAIRQLVPVVSAVGERQLLVQAYSSELPEVSVLPVVRQCAVAELLGAYL
jgi:hypothetical protein